MGQNVVSTEGISAGQALKISIFRNRVTKENRLVERPMLQLKQKIRFGLSLDIANLPILLGRLRSSGDGSLQCIERTSTRQSPAQTKSNERGPKEPVRSDHGPSIEGLCRVKLKSKRHL